MFYKIVLLHFFSFFQGMQTRERAHCARSVFPFIKKKRDTGAAISLLSSKALPNIKTCLTGEKVLMKDLTRTTSIPLA